MSQYVFIESRDPFESRDTDFIEETALAVKDRGHDVTVFLVQNGVLAARKSVQRLNRLVDADVTLLADELSLTERGIKPDELATGVQPVAIDELVERIVKEKTKAIWH
jgi:sulfur relay protein TusB/DsrH